MNNDETIDDEYETDTKRRIRLHSERVRSGKKNVFNIAAASSKRRQGKVKLPTFSFSEKDKS